MRTFDERSAHLHTERLHTESDTAHKYVAAFLRKADDIVSSDRGGYYDTQIAFGCRFIGAVDGYGGILTDFQSPGQRRKHKFHHDVR